MPWQREERSFTMQELLSALGDESCRQLASALYFEAQKRCGNDELAVASQISRAADVLLDLDQKEKLKRQSTRDSLAGVSDGVDATGRPAGGNTFRP